jgi:hypothetical protein
MTTLRDEILARGFDLKNRDDGAIAAAMSAGRTRQEPTEIGVGGILDTLVPSVLTQAQADALKGLAIKPDVITAQDVARALEGM